MTNSCSNVCNCLLQLSVVDAVGFKLKMQVLYCKLDIHTICGLPYSFVFRSCKSA